MTTTRSDFDGKFVGIAVVRTSKSASPGGMMAGLSQGPVAIIVRAEDILEAAKQVPEFKEKPEAQEETAP